MKEIIYVDEADIAIGSGTIRYAIENGIIRRVSRVILINDRGDILLQRRSEETIPYPGLWNDSASGHVDVGETYHDAAVRELEEEMGISGITLAEVGKFYREEKEGALTRKAFNMLYTGVFNGAPDIDRVEVSEAKWVSTRILTEWLSERPHEFTPELIQGFKLFLKSLSVRGLER